MAVHWSRWGPPLLLVEQRDHKAAAVLRCPTWSRRVRVETVTTSTLLEASDAAWVDWPVGVPAWLDGGDLLWAIVAEPGGSTWRLKVGDELVTPPGLQVREVTSTGRSVVFTASDDPVVVEAWSLVEGRAGSRKLTDVGGVSAATGDGPVKVVVSRSMSWPGPRATVVSGRLGATTPVQQGRGTVVDPAVKFLTVGRQRAARRRRPARRARREANCR